MRPLTRQWPTGSEVRIRVHPPAERHTAHPRARTSCAPERGACTVRDHTRKPDVRPQGSRKSPDRARPQHHTRNPVTPLHQRSSGGRPPPPHARTRASARAPHAGLRTPATASLAPGAHRRQRSPTARKTQDTAPAHGRQDHLHAARTAKRPALAALTERAPGLRPWRHGPAWGHMSHTGCGTPPPRRHGPTADQPQGAGTGAAQRALARRPASFSQLRAGARPAGASPNQHAAEQAPNWLSCRSRAGESCRHRDNPQLNSMRFACNAGCPCFPSLHLPRISLPVTL